MYGKVYVVYLYAGYHAFFRVPEVVVCVAKKNRQRRIGASDFESANKCVEFYYLLNSSSLWARIAR